VEGVGASQGGVGIKAPEVYGGFSGFGGRQRHGMEMDGHEMTWTEMD